MSHRLRAWPLIILCLQLSCAGFLFLGRDNLKSGIKNFQEKKYTKAINNFNKVIKKDPNSLVAYRYLYLCNRAINNDSFALLYLVKQIQLKTTDVNVYRLSYEHFRKIGSCKKCFDILQAANFNIPKKLDPFIPITREELAFLFAGASSKYSGKDFISFVEKNNLMGRFPDGNFYAKDRVTLGNFILTISKIIPDREGISLPLTKGLMKLDLQSSHYRPTIKLIAYKIIELSELTRLEDYLTVTLAINGISRLKRISSF